MLAFDDDLGLVAFFRHENLSAIDGIPKHLGQPVAAELQPQVFRFEKELGLGDSL